MSDRRLSIAGVGPGPRDLITVRGRRRLRAAEVVFFGADVGSAILCEAPEAAELVACVQTPGDAESVTESHQRAVARAAAGERVVWLLSYPSRDASQVQSLRALCDEAGIACELIPAVRGGATLPADALAGKRVLVTRARAQAESACRVLEERGAVAICMPTIAIAAPEQTAPLDEAARAISRYDWVVLSSANGVRHLARALRRVGRDARALAGCRVVAVGPKTAEALSTQLGVRADLVASDHRAEGIVAALDPEQLRGRRVLLPRAAAARDVLPDALRGWGATVDAVTAYVNVAPRPEQFWVGLRALRSGGVDILTFASPSAAARFAELLGDELQPLTRALICAAIGEVTAKACATAGLRVDVVPERQTWEDLVAAIAAHLA